MSQFKVYCVKYCAPCCAPVKQHIITTLIIFSCQNDSFSINDAPLFKAVAFNIALDVGLFNLGRFDASPFDA